MPACQVPSFQLKDPRPIPWTFGKAISQSTSLVELINTPMKSSKVYMNAHKTPEKAAM